MVEPVKRGLVERDIVLPPEYSAVYLSTGLVSCGPGLRQSDPADRSKLLLRLYVPLTLSSDSTKLGTFTVTRII
jgi:hypothetical protein